MLKKILASDFWGKAIVSLCVLHLAILTIRGTGREQDYLLIIASLLIAFHVRPE